MMSSSVLSDKDVNMAMMSASNPASASTAMKEHQQASGKEGVRSLEYHRQVLQSKMEAEK